MSIGCRFDVDWMLSDVDWMLSDVDWMSIGCCMLLLQARAVATNADMAAALGVRASAAITCVKPSGTVSQLVDAASGIHARHAPLFVRTVILPSRAQ
eukprot:5573379-Pyramimonas_sp.AAC.1